jgi:hypothetical protein
MSTVADIFAKFDGLQIIADALGVSVQAVSNMRARNAIAVSHWRALIALAQRVGVAGVTADRLLEIASAQSTSSALPVVDAQGAPAAEASASASAALSISERAA